MEKALWSFMYSEPYNCTLDYRMLLAVGFLCLLEGGGCILEAVGFSHSFVVVKLENEQLIGSLG